MVIPKLLTPLNGSDYTSVRLTDRARAIERTKGEWARGGDTGRVGVSVVVSANEHAVHTD